MAAKAAPGDRDMCLWCNTPIFYSQQHRWLHTYNGSAICPSVNVATPRTTEPH